MRVLRGTRRPTRAEKELRKKLRAQGAHIPPLQSPSDRWRAWRNRPLQNQAEVDQALAEVAACGLAAHQDAPKNWDLLVALGSILDATRPNERVLEMGAARYSRLLEWLFSYGYGRLVGIDLVTPRDRLKGPIRNMRMDLTRTTFPDGSFGAIACLSVIEHGVSLDAYLREAWRLLRPGGVLVTSTDFWCTALETEGKEAYGVPVRIFLPDDMRTLVASARKVGFQLESKLDLACGDAVVNWERVGLRYTFVNVVLHKPWTRRARVMHAVRQIRS